MYLIKTFEQFFVQANETEWKELYNPHKATLFKSKALAQQWMKDHTTFTQYAQYVNAKEAIAAYDEWISNGGVRRVIEYVDNKFSRKYDPKKDTAIDVLNWRYDQSKRNEATIRYEDYRTWPQLHSLFSHIFNTETYRVNEGDSPYQTTFQIYTSKNGDLKKFKEELKLILPKAEIITEDGYAQFQIFDYECSEFDTYHFLYKNAKDCKIVASRYRTQVMAEGDVKYVFEYMKRERYYG
jgi:hypothetical protein